MKTVVIAETSNQVDWARKNKHEIIIPITIAAQFRLLQSGISPENYLELNPDKKTSQKYIHIAEKFANTWFRLFKSELTSMGDNFGIYCRMHWLFFIPELLRAFYVVNKILSKYRPETIIIFPKDERLEVVDDMRPLEAFVIQHLHDAISKAVQVVQKTDFDTEQKYSRFSLTNLKRYGNYFTENPGDIFSAVKLLVSHRQRKGNILIPKADIVLHTQRHIITDSLPLISAIKKSGLNLLIVADSLLLIQKIQLAKQGVNYLDYNLIATLTANSKWHNNFPLIGQRILYSPALKKFLANLKLGHLSKVIAMQMEVLFTKFSHQVFLAQEVSNRVLDTALPKVMLLSGNSGRRGLAFAYGAKKRRMHSFLLQHGVDIPPVQSSQIFDHKIVWGKYWQKWYSQQMKLPVDRFFPAGWFYVDNISEKIQSFQTRKPDREKDRKIIFFPLAYYMMDNYKLLAIVSGVIKQFSQTADFKLVIRPHPGQNFPIGVEKYIDQASVEWDLGRSLDDQIQKADLVLTLGTTVGLRAMLWGKPLIHLKILGVVDEINFTDFGAAVEVKEIKKLIPTIKILLEDTKARAAMLTGQQRFIVDRALSLDGKSSQRVLRFILQKISP